MTMLRFVLVGVLSAIFLGAASGVFANTLGPLANVLIMGEEDKWHGSMERGGYWLENPSEQGAIRYFYAPYVEGSGGKRKYSIDVDVSNTTTDGRAGMLYGLQGDPLRYFMILIGRGGQVEVYRRDGNGVNQMMASTVQIKPGLNRIEIREDGRSVEYFVNGNSMGSFESNDTGAGSLGIAAMGIGRFGFANYVEGETGGWFN